MFKNLLDLKYKAYCEGEQNRESLEQLAQEFDQAHGVAMAYLAYPFYDTIFSCYTKITSTQIALLEVIIETIEKAPAGSPFIRSYKELAHSKALLGEAQELFNNQQLDPDFLSPECKERIAKYKEATANNHFNTKALESTEPTQTTSTYKRALISTLAALTFTTYTYYIWTEYQARRGFFANIGR